MGYGYRKKKKYDTPYIGKYDKENGFRSHKGDIVFDEDIINEVVRRTGHSKKKVEIAFNYIFNYMLINNLRKPNNFVFKIPFIGRIYFKANKAMGFFKHRYTDELGNVFYSNNRYRDIHNKSKLLKDEITKFLNEKVPPHFDFQFPQLIADFQNQKKYSLNMSRKEMEEFQNAGVIPSWFSSKKEEE